MPDEFHQALTKHLLRFDGDEDLCFASYVPSNGHERFSGIITGILLPRENERNLHGNVGFLPLYFERVLRVAREKKEGIVFLHSHPFPGWQSMSHNDISAEKRMSAAVFSITQLPLLGMTIGTDEAWSARFWTKDYKEKRKFNRVWCESVRIIGKKLTITFNDKILPPNFDFKKQLRTISAWGKKTQEDISRLKIGIVGLGSVGSLVAENLVRTGISFLSLIDFDTVEEKNLDRLTNVYSEDIGRSKVKAIKDRIYKSATSPNIQISAIEYSACEKDGFLAALDCDVLFSCVDRPWPRQVLNFISYAHMIPVIDGGILVRTNKSNTKIIGADWKIQTIGYKRPCLECLGQYKTANANLEKEGYLDDPNYITGLKDSGFVDAHENVFPFSAHLAAMEVLQLLYLVIAPNGISDMGQQMFHFIPGIMEKDTDKCCCNECYFKSIVGKGDFSNVLVYGKHDIAERTRLNRIRND